MNKVTDVLSFVNKHDVKFIRLTIVDIIGTKRSVELPLSSLSDAMMGRVMCDSSSLKGGSSTDDSDRAIIIDESSAALSSEGILEIYGSLKPNSSDDDIVDSREILKRAIKILDRRGYRLNVGLEPEFYLLNKNTLEPIDSGDYFSLTPFDLGATIRREAARSLMDEGYLIGPFHHEVGPGQCEINFAFDEALAVADRLFRYKEIIKSTAFKHNAIASFKPKPFKDLPGSGMHLNCSLARKDGVNAFFDDKEVHNISRLTYQFIGGILSHVRPLTSLACTTANSYKRLHSGMEAPGQVYWSYLDRGAAIRIPSASKEKTRIELRFVDNSANLYLLLAGIIAAGLEGMDRTEQLIDYSKKNQNQHELPHTLSEALASLKDDHLMTETLGKKVIEQYLRYKMPEASIDISAE